MLPTERRLDGGGSDLRGWLEVVINGASLASISSGIVPALVSRSETRFDDYSSFHCRCLMFCDWESVTLFLNY